MSRSIEHTPDSYLNRVPKHWSQPHQNVMRTLHERHESGFVTEEPVTGKCDSPTCRHEWLADFLWRREQFIVEVHGDFNDTEEYEQRTRCLQGAGFTVHVFPASMKKDLVANAILLLLCEHRKETTK